MNPFQSLNNYEEYIYTLKQNYSIIQNSTLIIIKHGKRTAITQGDITFRDNYKIIIKERLSFDEDNIIIESYGYEIWHQEKKISWYDCQPHPNNLQLKSTHPHHKHILPNIKNNRIPAPVMRFDQPNIPFLIEEIKSLLNS